MSIYDSPIDTPGRIRAEGQQIRLTFTRIDDSTGVISWNIPAPSTGCNGDNQAYNGIVITIANKPVNYLSTSPSDGKYYTADNTGDFDLHAGSKLDYANVIGTFYNDKTTVSMVVTGLSPLVPYYVSGYAVDAQARYHREGVHAYSLPSSTGQIITDPSSSYHDIQITSPIKDYTLTGLLADKIYKFSIEYCCKRYDFEISGKHALNYGNLVNAINAALSNCVCPYRAPLPPNAGEYYLKEYKELYQWDGWKYDQKSLLVSDVDPSLIPLGTYWYNGEKLYIYTINGWMLIDNIIYHLTDPTLIDCTNLWFDGTLVREYDGSKWIELTTYITERNPLLPPLLGCDTYWYNTLSELLYHWNIDTKKWDNVFALYYDIEPSLIDGMRIYLNTTDNKLHYVGDDSLVKLTHIKSRVNECQSYFKNGVLWTYQDGEIVETEYIISPINPHNVMLWWNSNDDMIYGYDKLNDIWVKSIKFYQSDVDPSLPSLLPDNSVWINPVTKILTRIMSAQCDNQSYIFSKYDPLNLPLGTIWYDGSQWHEYGTFGWFNIYPLLSINPPDLVNDGDFWLETPYYTLFKRVDNEWVITYYSDTDLTPNLGEFWFNTQDNILMEWDNVTWIPAVSFAQVLLVERTCKDDYDALRFLTKQTGCSKCDTAFKVVIDNDTLFTHLTHSVIYTIPIEGKDALIDGPSYKQLHVGDDGSPEERKTLHHKIRVALGYPTIQVELTTEALDFCIDNALLIFRKHSSYATQKGYTFIDFLPNQQEYILTNTCKEWNKIVQITNIYRVKPSIFGTAYGVGQSDMFAQAALQHLYRTGTFDILTFHLSMSYLEELETLFATRIMFDWNEKRRKLKIFNVLARQERVLMEVYIEKTEQDILTDRESAHFIQRWAIMEAKRSLSQIRGKYQALPGPNGSTSLNAQDLITQADNEQQLLEAELSDMSMQDMLTIGLHSTMLFG